MQELKHVSAATDLNVEKNCTMCEGCKHIIETNYNRYSKYGAEASS